MSRPYLILLVLAGCAASQISQQPGADVVVRRTNWKKWKRFTPESEVTFGEWYVQTHPSWSRTSTKKKPFSFTGKQSHHVTSDVAFALHREGKEVAKVFAGREYKSRSIKVPILGGRAHTESDDVLTGRVESPEGAAMTFSLDGFTSSLPDTKATGVLGVGDRQIQLREIEAPWHDYRDGLAGVDFVMDGEKVGQVIRGSSDLLGGKPESVWIDPQLPSDAKTAIAGTSAALLLIQRNRPSPQAD